MKVPIRVLNVVNSVVITMITKYREETDKLIGEIFLDDRARVGVP